MSLPMNYDRKCVNCGCINDIYGWASNFTYGSADLDYRPAEDFRSILNQVLVKRCKSCGYCNNNLEQIVDGMESIIASERYQKLMISETYPKKANEFVCKSMLLCSVNESEDAGWAMMHAAWCCDDDNYYTAGKFCRKKAMQLFVDAFSKKKIDETKEINYPLVFVDLYRKVENFESALVHVNKSLALYLSPHDRVISQFQKFLIESKNTKTYRIEDAYEYNEKNIKG